jgi:hypothetical protein
VFAINDGWKGKHNFVGVQDDRVDRGVRDDRQIWSEVLVVLEYNLWIVYFEQLK